MIIAFRAVRVGQPVVAGCVKNYSVKKRLILLSVAATAIAAVAAVQAGAIGSAFQIRGTNTFCLAPEAARTLTEQKVEVEPIAPATASGTCVTLQGTGTLAPDVTSGEGTLTGGMRFTGGGHRLEVTNLQGHVRFGEGSTSADLAQDGGPVTNVDFAHWPISLSRVSMTPTTASMKDNPVTLTDKGTAAFVHAFGAGPTPGNTPLWSYEGKGELSNPFRSPAKP
ncbi:MULTISPECIES: HtaA domain-containing protein [unclassified Streptomyces]|uniref:HtaA domain-containing protein n=1 Tax=unclassified Streptomyces TaxID=2593676 RepID=UPI00343E0003